MQCEPYDGKLEWDDYIYLLQAQCDRWSVDLRVCLASKEKHHVALRALVFKILHQSGFSLNRMAHATSRDATSISRLIRDCDKHEAWLVEWRNGHTRKRVAKPKKAEIYARYKASQKPVRSVTVPVTKPTVWIKPVSKEQLMTGKVSPSAPGVGGANLRG